jgi:hypothetical protein
MVENWLPVPGYESRYLISDLGNVIAINYQRRGKPKHLVLYLHPSGYYKVTLTKDGKWKVFSVHVLAMLAFVGPRPPNLHINHMSCIKTDNRLVNLEYCTGLENSQHALRNGRYAPAHGENHYLSRLKIADVIDIKRKVSEGIPQKDIAKEFGICQSHVSVIASGRRRTREVKQWMAKQESLTQEEAHINE